MAILASKLGAEKIDALDIEHESYMNTIENASINGVNNISVFEGDLSVMPASSYDVILANINRNILLNDMQSYVDCLLPNGTILFSGFYEEDIPFINASCVEKGLTYVKKLERNNWVSLKYINS